MKRSIGKTDLGANTGRTVTVIGGGIAGLATALAFRQRGADVTVLEQAPVLKEVGAGLQITPNGAVVLTALGLGMRAAIDGLAADAVVPTDALTGRVIARFDLTHRTFGPYRFFHRADLLSLLADACDAQGVVLCTDAHVDTVTPDGRAVLDDGRVVAGDLLVGADGLKSRARPAINGADEPFFTGQVAWRSVIALPGAPPEARIWMAPGRHVVTYPLTGGRVNIVAVQERDAWANEGWHSFDAPDAVQSAFGDCDESLQDILGRITTVRRWGLFRHPVAARWHAGRTVILGDAAHPTLPFLAQGANLALEDAFALVALCDQNLPLDQALARFQELRRPRVIRAIAAANANARNYHLSGLRRTSAHAALGLLGRIAPHAFLKRMDWLYGYNVTADQAAISIQTGT